MSFGSAAPFTIGLEEELLLVEPTSFALAPVAGRVIAAVDGGEQIGHEVYAASVELRSRPSATAAAAARELGGLRARVAAAGGTLAGAGVHPAAEHGDAALVDDPRYRRVEDEMRGLVRRTPECALHVHVAMPDAETAVRVFNRMRSHLPLLQGLAANSPWWFGADSGLASARAALVRAYPGRGIPRPLRDEEDWISLVAATTAAGELPDYTFLWWDVRLHPRLGTIEVRELDTQSSLADAAALGALVRALAAESAEVADEPEPSETLAWSAFHAMRDGVEASLLDRGTPRPLGEVARDVVARLRPFARELGDAEELERVLGMARAGGAATRRRRAQADGGMRRQLEQLVEETTHPSPIGAERTPAPTAIRP